MFVTVTPTALEMSVAVTSVQASAPEISAAFDGVGVGDGVGLPDADDELLEPQAVASRTAPRTSATAVRVRRTEPAGIT